MNDDTKHTLVPSTNRGRYALDDPEGQDITGGDRIIVWLGGQWIEGSVEHAGMLYANESSGRAIAAKTAASGMAPCAWASIATTCTSFTYTPHT
jgi:hypothetical protein